MPDNVELSVKSQLQKIVQDLEAISNKSEEVGKDFQKMGKETAGSLKGQAQDTETFLTKMSSMGGRALGRLTSDFKALISMQSLVTGFKFSEQFKGGIKETVSLSDTIRKLGTMFGIARGEFMSFQTSMTKGLGRIGISSVAASNALRGLADQPVKGKEALLEYSKVAGQLGIIGGERGKEGDISRGIAKTITARGGDASDVKQIREVAESLAKIREVTGKAPTESLKAMDQLFTAMPENFRKKFSTKMLEGLATAAVVGGQNATKFLEQYLSLSDVQRAGMEARGIGNIIDEEGLNLDALKKFADEAKKLGGGDFRLGMKAMGVEGDAAAEGAIRLVEATDRLGNAQKKLLITTVDLRKMQLGASSMSESFAANINKIKGIFATPFTFVTQGITKGLSKASETASGAAAVTIGGGVLSALLAGIGLRGVGKGMGGGAIAGLGKAAAVEQMTGRKVTPVYVVNASEMGGGIGAAAGAGGLMGFLGKAAGMAFAASVGVVAGRMIGEGALALLGKTPGSVAKGLVEGALPETEGGKLGKAAAVLGLGVDTVRRAFSGEEQLKAPTISRPWEKEHTIIIKDHTGKLTSPTRPSRGVSFAGPRGQ